MIGEVDGDSAHYEQKHQHDDREDNYCPSLIPHTMELHDLVPSFPPTLS